MFSWVWVLFSTSFSSSSGINAEYGSGNQIMSQQDQGPRRKKPSNKKDGHVKGLVRGGSSTISNEVLYIVAFFAVLLVLMAAWGYFSSDAVLPPQRVNYQ
eukprot:TRINITY_DN3839_c0_g2_i2.p1 TRINITY_DN3839_c0_g2~~TRINITY_DN3839_c0_g2_i2.p1  ORF type:complete len:100 (-),score=16.04 TRINITY_DN3839_c0_g2_i2:14-313(-)